MLELSRRHFNSRSSLPAVYLRVSVASRQLHVKAVSCHHGKTSSMRVHVESVRETKFNSQYADLEAHAAGRRAALACMSAFVLLPRLSPASEAQAIPLAPLGSTKRIGGDKLTSLSDDQVKDILEKDISEGQYFVTGNLTRELFSDNCRFVDPTNDVSGLSRYLTALGILFDPEFSKVILNGIQVTAPRTIEADYTSGGYLRSKYFPWRPRVAAYKGHVTYTLDADGLVAVQAQTWDISPAEALRETFTPTFGPRVPVL